MKDLTWRDPPLWERLAPQEIPGCSTANIVGFGILPGFLVTLSIAVGSWYLVLTGSAEDYRMALQAQQLQTIAPAAGPHTSPR